MKRGEGILKKVRIKGKTRAETLENISIYGIIGGAFLLSFGIGLTSIKSEGGIVFIPITGALLSFLFTVILIFVWLFEEKGLNRSLLIYSSINLSSDVPAERRAFQKVKMWLNADGYVRLMRYRS